MNLHFWVQLDHLSMHPLQSGLVARNHCPPKGIPSLRQQRAGALSRASTPCQSSQQSKPAACLVVACNMFTNKLAHKACVSECF